MDNLITQKQPKRSFAFFDVDDTIVANKSMFSFQDYWYKQHPSPKAQAEYLKDMEKRHDPNASWEDLNKVYYSHFSGRSVEHVRACAAAWFSELSATHPKLFHDAVVRKVHEHQARDQEVVFVSGSFPEVLRPLADILDVEHILATNMQQEDGVFTGEILFPQTIGKGKAIAIEMFLKQHNGDAEASYAYGDDISDLPMLESVGNPVVVRGGRGLEQHGNAMGWTIISPYSRPIEAA